MTHNRLNWQDYFMGLAKLTAQRSPDPNTQVGSVLVDTENHIIGVGYNGAPKSVEHNLMPWDNSNTDPLLNKYLYIVHSELNCILNADHSKIKNSILYCTLAPCAECAKSIVQVGIKEVVYLNDKHSDKPEFIAGKKLLDLARIKHYKYIPSVDQITIILK